MNRAKVVAEVIGNYSLTLPSRHILRSYKVLYFAKATTNIKYVFVLCKNGYNV